MDLLAVHPGCRYCPPHELSTAIEAVNGIHMEENYIQSQIQEENAVRAKTVVGRLQSKITQNFLLTIFMLVN